MAQVIVFTDLDGTLLDHRDYGHAPARPVLDRMRRAGVPLVLASSKTAAEMLPLREAFGFADVPMICENGAGVVETAPPDDAGPRRGILAALTDAPGRADFEGFADMTPERLVEVTGLPPSYARAAAQRCFSEPGLWHGTPEGEAACVAGLAELGVMARRGGRVRTLGLGHTKAGRMAEIAAGYGQPVTVALGDAPNDAEMIAAADHGIVVANPAGPGLPTLPGETTGRVRRSTRPGPEGWAEMLNPLLDRLGIDGNGG